jgi:hypothetical protein
MSFFQSRMVLFMKVTPFEINLMMALSAKIMRQSMPDYQTHLVSGLP